MKNLQKGFIVPVILVVIALLVVSGGVYVYKNKVDLVSPIQQKNPQTPPVVNQQNPTNTQPVNVEPQPKPVISNLSIIKPTINETWQIGTPHTIQWKLNVDSKTLHGSLFLTVLLKDSSGNLINAQVGQNIEKNQNSTTISIPYFNPSITPGKYHLVLNIYDTIAALPCVGCEGYSKLVGSATTSAVITLTASDGKVKR